MSGASEGERGNAYRAIRRFAISCSPRKAASGVLAQPSGTAVAVVGVEHDPTTTRFAGEHAGHDARQKYRAEAPVDERRVGDRGVQSDVVGIGGISGGDGILCGPIEFDVTEVLAASTTDERRASMCRRVGPADTAATATTASRTPTPPPDAGGSSSRTSCRRRHPGRRGGWRRARPGSAWGRADLTDVGGDRRQLTREDRLERLVNIGHRPTSLPQQVRIGLPT